MSEDVTIEVQDRPAEGRFAVTVDGDDAGGAYYKRRGDLVIFDHTEVADRYEGKGVGSALARAALDAVRAAGDKVVPLCPFINGYIQRHPDYQDLVDQQAFDELRR